METDNQARLLIADDEDVIRESYAELLRAAGHAVDTAADEAETLTRVRENRYDLLLTDLRFPDTDGIRILRECKRIRPSLLVAIFTGYATVPSVLQAFRAGAFDFIEKPVPSETLKELAGRAAEIRRMGEQRRRMAEDLENERVKVLQLRQQLAAEDPFQKLVGSSPMMQSIHDTICEVARTDSTVLLTGESGTGKGLVARTIHEASTRADKPFVEANCVVYSEGVLHSELFGHEKGAFTGAARTKRGRFELARKGTLFLDEIGDISPATQLLLLRVLQEKRYERVGGEETFEADVRLIAATNRDLPRAIEQGQFRSDLFYRLNVIPLHLPALREHAEDIPMLAQHFLSRCASRMGRGVETFSEDALEAMVRYDWPGNVRELENLVERLVVLNRSGRVEVEELPAPIQSALSLAPLKERPGTLQEMERVRIQAVLEETGGNKKLAARKLGIHRSTLYAKLRRYGLDSEISANESDPQHEASEKATWPTTA